MGLSQTLIGWTQNLTVIPLHETVGGYRCGLSGLRVLGRDRDAFNIWATYLRTVNSNPKKSVSYIP